MPEDKKIDFSNKEERKKISQQIAEGFYDNPEEIKKWYHIKLGLEKFLKDKKDLKQTDLLIYQECSDLLNKIQWFCIDYLSSNDFINLFKTNLNFVLSDKTYPLERQLSLFLLNIPDLFLRDEYKTRIREAVLANEEKITPDEIIFKTGKRVLPTIANWLSFYDQTLGTGKIEKLKMAEVLFKDRNIIQLLAKNKEKIKRLFAFYEELKISAATVEGLEEEDIVATEKGLEVHKRNRIDSAVKSVAVKAEAEKRIEQEIEKEIEKEKNKLPPPSIDLNQAIANVTNRAGLSFPDESLKTRFQNIINSFFRDVRTEIETKIVLKRDHKIGGMGFDESVTDKIIQVLKQEKPQIKPIKKTSLPESTGGVVLPPLNKMEKIIQAETKVQRPIPQQKKEVLPPKSMPKPVPKSEPVPVPPPKPKPVLPPKPELQSEAALVPEADAAVPLAEVLPPKPSAPTPIPQPKFVPPFKPKSTPVLPPKLAPKPKPKLTPKPPIPMSQPQPKAGPPLAEVLPPKPTSVPQPQPVSTPRPTPGISKQTLLTEEQKISVRRPSPEPTKTRVEEVKVEQRSYGPIEELQTIALADWRRWGTPKHAAQKIQDKINLLGEESLVKKAEGIKAWKDSIINQLYLDIGAESIDRGKSVTEIIAQRQQQSLSTLTEEEFNAVVELNQKLRF